MIRFENLTGSPTMTRVLNAETGEDISKIVPIEFGAQITIAKEGITVQVGRGRPKKLAEVGGTSPRSVRAARKQRAHRTGGTLNRSRPDGAAFYRSLDHCSRRCLGQFSEKFSRLHLLDIANAG